jgi:hypothetical protein
MMDMGIEPGRYIVGNELNSRNPVTGQPEFFLKKIVSQIRKALPGDSEKFLGPLVGLATGKFLPGAIAGAIGDDLQGAILGGGAGFFSPGMKTIFGQPIKGGTATNLSELFKGTGKNIAKTLGIGSITPEKVGTVAGLSSTEQKQLFEIPGVKEFFEKSGLDLDAVGGDPKKLTGKDYLTYTILLGLVLDQFQGDQGPVGMPLQALPEGQSYESILNPIAVGPSLDTRAEGGVMDLRQGGESEGPGTGTSDDIPAMLSDGEFVMTAKAVRGAGGGDRREGAKRMYQMMDNLEARA